MIDKDDNYFPFIRFEDKFYKYKYKYNNFESIELLAENEIDKFEPALLIYELKEFTLNNNNNNNMNLLEQIAGIIPKNMMMNQMNQGVVGGFNNFGIFNHNNNIQFNMQFNPNHM